MSNSIIKGKHMKKEILGDEYGDNFRLKILTQAPPL